MYKLIQLNIINVQINYNIFKPKQRFYIFSMLPFTYLLLKSVGSHCENMPHKWVKTNLVH